MIDGFIGWTTSNFIPVSKPWTLGWKCSWVCRWGKLKVSISKNVMNNKAKHTPWFNVRFKDHLVSLCVCSKIIFLMKQFDIQSPKIHSNECDSTQLTMEMYGIFCPDWNVCVQVKSNPRTSKIPLCRVTNMREWPPDFVGNCYSLYSYSLIFTE